MELHVGRQRHVLAGDLGLISFFRPQTGRVTVQETQRSDFRVGSDVLCTLSIHEGFHHRFTYSALT